jgi:A/G-specific adenine glycosylase
MKRAQIKAFQGKVHAYYEEHGRVLPWRKNINPYRVLVSEIMLQQTQVERVIDKYREFLSLFPDFQALAAAPTTRLLAVWSGMGYNRRALALRALAQQVVDRHRGKLPKDEDSLRALPGIGKYTAGAVQAFAFNLPVVFMDTNIRRVYIHEFFEDQTGIHDEELLPLVEQTLDREAPRTWYNALMDYGTMLKRNGINPNRRSAHYTRQSPFENSNRQVRGLILKALVKEPLLSAVQIAARTGVDQDRVTQNLLQLEREGFVRKDGRSFTI